MPRAALERWGVRVWSDVQVENDAGSRFEGVILPRSETLDDLHVVIKLKNGYNVGLHVDRVRSVKEVGYKEAIYKIPEKEFPRRPNLPGVTLLGTGGTIASRLDYRTGAVIPAFTPGELYGAVPELADICNLTTKKLFGVFSENMAREQYITLARAIGEEIENGADGIVIGHGTDTMGHTAAILSFMVQDTPVPIVLVGSQRSSDRPSSDAALNLIHSGAVGRVRRHRRGADLHVRPDLGPLRPAAPRDALPQDAQLLPQHLPDGRRHPAGHRRAATASRTSTATTGSATRRGRSRSTRSTTTGRRSSTTTRACRRTWWTRSSRRATAGSSSRGPGLGHVNKPLYPALKKAIQKGVHVVMTVQTLWGYAQMYVYDTGRDLLEIGIVPLDNMLPETALMKLSWVLAHTDDHGEVLRMMRRVGVARDHRPRAPQRVPDHAGRPPGDRGVHHVALEVGTRE